jgi:predicted TIM-barrel fold metal-dependent hydrolase
LDIKNSIDKTDQSVFTVNKIQREQLKITKPDIFLLKKSRDSIEGRKLKNAYDKNMEVLLRLNGFFIGAIGVNMIMTGIKKVRNWIARYNLKSSW